MTRHEYSDHLDVIAAELENEISEEKIETILGFLEVLYDFKPVSPRWHQLKCKALMKQGNMSDIIRQFNDKISKEYIFEGNIELWEQLIEVYRQTGQSLEGDRQAYMLSKLAKGNLHVAFETELQEVRRRFMEGEETKEILCQLEECYYRCSERFMAYCIYCFESLKYPELRTEIKESMYLSMDNFAYVSEYITDKKPIILVLDSEKREDYDILSYLFHSFELPVYLLSDRVEIEGEYRLEDTVQISLDHLQVFEDCIMIPPVARVKDGNYLGDNIPYLIDCLCQKITDDDFAITITSNTRQTELRSHKDISKRYERLSCYEAKYIEDEIGFGRAGDYCTYISRLYKTDVRKLLDREPECDFSIVVPVRNATETLYHTLRTCLEQDYEGTWEVLLSDNSVEGDDSVLKIFESFQDQRLRYCKTPFSLSLTKSFEFAYLQSNGKFVIPIGADDGVLPWALRVLSDIRDSEQGKVQNIICWDRGFYVWPGFNGGQENQFEIPNHYKKDQIDVRLYQRDIYRELFNKNLRFMYCLPNMYLNSGFAKSYLRTLYEKTGCILDGMSQDVYMGLTNISINDVILHIHYPITIAGMSSMSMGGLMTKIGAGENIELENASYRLIGERGRYAYVQETGKSVTFGTDFSDFCFCMEQLRKKHILPLDIYAENDRKNMLTQCLESINILRDKYMQNILEGYEVAKNEDGEFALWYKNNIIPRCETMVYISKEYYEEMKVKKRYKEGYKKSGGIILDASRFGVDNIYKAVCLFKEFLHF